MAMQSVKPQQPEPVVPAITEHYIESGWEQSQLAVGVRNRLARVERCVTGMATIQRMLAADALGKDDAADNPEVEFAAALHPLEVEGLRLAAEELGHRALDMLGTIRNREYLPPFMATHA
jgi:hypothetical protein